MAASASVCSTSSRSPMSPWTKATASGTFWRTPAYVSRSKATSCSSGRRSSQYRTKLEPMKPAAPVTRMRIRAESTARSAAFGAPQDRARLGAVGLELLGAPQIRDGLLAAAQPVERVAEVVIGEGFVRVGGPGPAQ